MPLPIWWGGAPVLGDEVASATSPYAPRASAGQFGRQVGSGSSRLRLRKGALFQQRLYSCYTVGPWGRERRDTEPTTACSGALAQLDSATRLEPAALDRAHALRGRRWAYELRTRPFRAVHARAAAPPPRPATVRGRRVGASPLPGHPASGVALIPHSGGAAGLCPVASPLFSSAR